MNVTSCHWKTENKPGKTAKNLTLQRLLFYNSHSLNDPGAHIGPRIPDYGEGTYPAAGSPAVRGRAPRWNEMHSRSYGLSEA